MNCDSACHKNILDLKLKKKDLLETLRIGILSFPIFVFITFDAGEI